MAKTKKKNLPKKGQSVAYKVGKAPKPIKGTVVRSLKEGTKMPKIKDLKSSYEVGEPVFRDSVILRLADGSLRCIPAGYVR